MHILLLTLSALALSCSFIVLLRHLAPVLGLLDRPGGRKDHSRVVPLVGGIALYATVITACLVLPQLREQYLLIAAAGLVVVVGVLDDRNEVSPRLRLVTQIAACLIMIYIGDVRLLHVGNLIGTGAIGMWIFRIPISIFAVLGVVNAFNMIDGIDGLSGLISLFALMWYGVMAYLSGQVPVVALATVLAGAVLGFLVFNLRLPWQPHARVFLGDAGSTLLGFVFGWMAIEITQPENATVPPICVLWVILLPLADTVSLMAYRVRIGVSPMRADRRHIHHLLQYFGLSKSATLWVLAMVSFLFGLVGYEGWRQGVPEPILFSAFAGSFFIYHFWSAEMLRRYDKAMAEREVSQSLK